MANEQIAQLRQADCTPGSGGLPAMDIGANLGRGLGFPAPLPLPFAAQKVAAYFLFFIPSGTSLATGITVSLLLTDDLANPSPGGLATFDIQFAGVTSGTTVENDAAFSGTNDSAQVTMPTGAANGKLKTQVIAAVNAHMAGTVAANAWCLLRVRRNPAASDTHTGRIILLGANVVNT